MKVIALIPARYAATRFPGKLMKLLGDRTVIRRTYDAAVATGLFDEVIIVTDSDIIYEEITRHGGKAIMSKKEHESGSDRIAEAAADMDVDVIVNVQGDEPFIKKDSLQKLVLLFNDPSVVVASLMKEMKDPFQIENPNIVKVVVDKKMNSLLFSRSVIPYPRDKKDFHTHYEHVGIYAFRKKALLDFTGWPATPLEMAEKIECLRFLENGIALRMAITDSERIAIDTPEDLERARAYL